MKIQPRIPITTIKLTPIAQPKFSKQPEPTIEQGPSDSLMQKLVDLEIPLGFDEGVAVAKHKVVTDSDNATDKEVLESANNVNSSFGLGYTITAECYGEALESYKLMTILPDIIPTTRLWGESRTEALKLIAYDRLEANVEKCDEQIEFARVINSAVNKINKKIKWP